MALWSAAWCSLWAGLRKTSLNCSFGVCSDCADRWGTGREAAQKCPAFPRSFFLPEKVALVFCAPPVERNVLALSAAASCFVRTKQTQHLTHTHTHWSFIPDTHTHQILPALQLGFKWSQDRTKTDRSEVRCQKDMYLYLTLGTKLKSSDCYLICSLYHEFISATLSELQVPKYSYVSSLLICGHHFEL